MRGSLVTVIAYNVMVVPRPRLEETIRSVNLINSRRTTYGAFWVNTERLRVAFELGIAAPDGLTQEQVSMAMTALGQVDDFYPILGAVIWGGMTAEQAMNPPQAQDEDVEASDTADEHEDEDGPALDIAV